MQLDIVSLIYLAIGVIGLFAIFFTFSIVRILFKHRGDNAPLTVFMLNPLESQKYVSLFIFPAVFILLTGITTIMQRFAGTPSFSNLPFTVFFFLSYAFGLVTIVVFLYVVYAWYRKMRRFA
ncbi:MAG: hypothetical protein QW292_14800 [Candidatus Parvarchaeota archaeon]